MKQNKIYATILVVSLIVGILSCDSKTNSKSKVEGNDSTENIGIQIVIDDSIESVKADIDTAKTIELLKSSPDMIEQNREYLLLFDYLKLEGNYYRVTIDEKKAHELGVRKEVYDQFVDTYNALNEELDNLKKSFSPNTVWRISSPRKDKAIIAAHVRALEEINAKIKNGEY